MPTPTPRRHRTLAVLVAVCGLLLSAPAAHATIVNQWFGLTGLQAPTPSWVRDYSTGTPPTTVFAGTEGDGVYFSLTSGIPGSWSKMGTLPPDAQEVYQVYTGNGKIYAVTGGGLFSTPSASPSATWTPDGGGPDDAEHPTKLDAVPQTVVSLTAGPMLAGTVSQGVWRSGDGGTTWTPPADNNGMPESDTVWNFATFLNFVWAATSDGIYRSADQGATWTLANDGIPFGDVTLNIFQEGNHLLPNVFYAATSDGVYRTLDAGVTWQPLDPADFPGNTQVHDMKEFSGDKETRLYTATSDGVWVATMPNIALPGPTPALADPLTVTWRHMTEVGLATGSSPNDIFWALQNFISTPGTFLAGTQSNGGYMLVMQPPNNSGQAADLPTVLGTANTQYHVGDAVVGTTGNWSGTPDIDYAYQWQRCTSTTVGSCSDIDGATNHIYNFVAADLNDRYRVCVIATNDFPEPVKALHEACSVIEGPPIVAPVAPLPGSTQLEAPTIHDVSPGAEDVLPTEGDTLSAPPDGALSGWSFNPAATFIGYQWRRCDVDGDNCQDIPNATSQTYVLTSADNGVELRVSVKGSNSQGGTTTLPISGATNPIIPLPAEQLAPPTLLGTQYVGDTLTGTVGTWKSPKTFWARQWERCEPDGSDCESIPGATGPEYTLTADDYGNTVRLHVSADVNPEIQLPLAVDAYTPLTAVIQYPPGVTPPPPPVPTPTPTPTPNPKPPTPKVPAPHVTSLKLVNTKAGSSVSFKLSGPGGVRLQLQLLEAGHRVKSHCVAGRKRHATSCTYYKTEETVTHTKLTGGVHSIALAVRVHGHRLPSGRYRVLVTPLDASGHAGTPHTLSLVLGRA